MPHALKFRRDAAELKYKGNTLCRIHAAATLCLERKKKKMTHIEMLRLRKFWTWICIIYFETLHFYWSQLMLSYRLYQLILMSVLNLTLYAPCTILQCGLDEPTRCKTSYKWSLFFFIFHCSTCFGRTICPSSGAPSNKLYNAFGTFVQASLAATWL